jgi:hypothetical protein
LNKIGVSICLIFSAFLHIAQEIECIEDLKFVDSLSKFNTWVFTKEYYSKDTIRYELKYRVNCEPCAFHDFKGRLRGSTILVEESFWRRDGTLQWSNKVYSCSKRSGVKMRVKYRYYSKSGRLAIRKQNKWLVL